MPLWLELVVMLLLTYLGGFAVGAVIWNRG
jgi:hypothetical protein